MPRSPQQQLLAEAWNHAVELHGETPFGKQYFEFAHRDQRLPNRLRVTAQPLCNLAQNTMGLAHLFFRETHQVVVEVDSLQRLDEERVPARARAVDDAIDFL